MMIVSGKYLNMSSVHNFYDLCYIECQCSIKIFLYTIVVTISFSEAKYIATEDKVEVVLVLSQSQDAELFTVNGSFTHDAEKGNIMCIYTIHVMPYICTQ